MPSVLEVDVMTKDPLLRMTAVADLYGTTDPMELIDRLKIRKKKIHGGLLAYLVWVDERTPTICINEELYHPCNEMELRRVLWHELTHYLEEHHGLATRVFIDTSYTLSCYADDGSICWMEVEANTVSAHMTIPTEEFLTRIGYYCSAARTRHKVKGLLKQAKAEYLYQCDRCKFDPTPQNLLERQKCIMRGRQLEEQLEEIDAELSRMDFTTSIPKLARLFHTNEAFIRYKYYALLLLGYEDLESIELSPYETAFDKEQTKAW